MDGADSAVAIQFFDREDNIRALVASLRSNATGSPEVLVNNDSNRGHRAWMKAFEGCGRCLVVYSPDLHEIRAYNRMGQLASPSAEVLAFIQDDDAPPRDGSWLRKARELLEARPTLGLIGGRAGRTDVNDRLEQKKPEWKLGGKAPAWVAGPMWQVDGGKFGRRRAAIRDRDWATGHPFMYVYKVNASPMVVRRSVFLRVGMFHPGYSCPGDAGISFDFEYSVRMWWHGYQVGLYDSQFKDAKMPPGSKGKGGTMRSVNSFRKRLEQWRTNNLRLYYMYPGFHHKRAMALVKGAAR